MLTDTPVRAEAGTSPPPVKPARKPRMPQWFWGVLLVLPSAVLVIGVIAVPIAYLARLSLTDAHAYLPRINDVGLGNFADLAASPQFWQSLRTTVVYATLTVAIQLALGVVVALLMHQKFRARGLVRLIAIAPYMIPAIIVALVWRWLLEPNNGAYSWIVRNVIPGADQVNLLSPTWIFVSLVVVSVWMYTPFVVISVLARLQTIDLSIIEAATVDGAGPWRRFWAIILPELSPVLLTLVLLRFMFMFTKFDIVYLFAGTGQEVRTLPLLTFQTIFGESRLGAGATLAMVMFGLLVIFTTVYLRTMHRRSEETE
ncbi:sugar ABC transporter permease [Occultella glacieicola]|uniref:Sugar ABC transporter permease n=1 Tax=Occultella glacieicola TaxID=2518684 RepID=A0ABY2DYF8_9MICO|nr:sugar ABC transporter permease [Occultella glacieicola]TDE89521.1 sugar ABC transporter permease [Occultella glacieicola]